MVSEQPTAESRKPTAESRQQKADSRKPTAESRQLKKKTMAKKGDRIYIEEREQYGEVVAVRPSDGKIITALVRNPSTKTGFEEINVLTLAIRLVTLIEQIIHFFKSRKQK